MWPLLMIGYSLRWCAQIPRMPTTFAPDRTAGFLLSREGYEAPPEGRHCWPVTNRIGALSSLQSMKEGGR